MFCLIFSLSILQPIENPIVLTSAAQLSSLLFHLRLCVGPHCKQLLQRILLAHDVANVSAHVVYSFFDILYNFIFCSTRAASLYFFEFITHRVCFSVCLF